MTPNKLAGAALALVALIASACSKEEPAAPPAPPAAEVGVVTLQARALTLSRELSGRVTPMVVAEVRPQVTGIVLERPFVEGSLVRKGQLLYKLDDATLRADLGAMRAALARAEATREATRLAAARTEELARIEAVSRQDAENANAALKQAEADAAAQRANVARAEVLLGYASIVAPITGRIGKSSVTQGALVIANQAATLATVQQLDPVYVDVTQSSRELLELRRELASGRARQVNTPVKILLEDGTEYGHPGRLAFSDVTVDPDTGSFLLRIAVPNPRNELLPGSFVRAVVGTAERRNALFVPQRGITRDPKGNASALVLKEGKVEARAVRVSRALDDQWLVEDGLVAGDQVIVEGVQKVRPGMPARASIPGAEGKQPAAQPAEAAKADGPAEKR